MAVTAAEILALFSDASRLVVSTDKFLIEGTTGTIKIPAEYVREYLIAGVTVTIGDDGYWYIGGTKQDTQASGDTISLERTDAGIVWYKNGVYQGVIATWADVGFNDIAVSFAADPLTNPYSSTPALTPRRIGDVAVNTTSLEIWNATSTTAATDSWQIVSQGKYGGTLITDAHSIIRNGFYSATASASNLPTSTESFYIQAMCSNSSNTSAILTAVGLTSGKMYMQRKVSGVWGSWVGGITQAELGYLTGTTSNVQAQIDSKADKDGDEIMTLYNNANAISSVISALLALVDNAGDHKAVSYDAEEGYKVCGFRTVIYGAGVPSSTTIPGQQGIPAFVGQIYIDTTAASNGLYYAVNTTAVSDWRNA